MATGDIYAMLQPTQTVYVTNDSLNLGNLKFVRITWGDSSGYVRAGWLIPQGKRALITHDAGTYKDIQLKEAMDTTFGGWQLMAIGNTTNAAAEIRYRRGNDIVTAYISRSDVSLDSADINFYVANKNAGSLDARTQMQAVGLLADEFADPKAIDRNYTPKDAGFYETFSDNESWTDAKGEQVDERPGEFGLFMNESKRNSQSNSLFDGMMDDGNGNYSVSKMTVVVVPSKNTDLLFKVRLVKTYTEDADTVNTYKRVFPHAQPGKAYELTFPNWGGCSKISISVQTKDGLMIKRYLGSDCSLGE
jgi:hypothetical protein